MPFYLAIDAGGTKTDYLLADETRELARVRSATIKRLRVDAGSARLDYAPTGQGVALSHAKIKSFVVDDSNRAIHPFGGFRPPRG